MIFAVLNHVFHMTLKHTLVVASLLLGISCGGGADPDVEEPDIVPMGRVEHVSLFSTELNRQMVTTVWLPAGYDADKTYPFLYLLHGYGDDNDSWILKGSASTIADNYIHDKGLPMVIVMPDGLVSFYTGPYDTFLHGTLMPEVEKRFNCNGKRALAGLSMGGYGTLYHALKYPEKFEYAYAMSPASDIDGFRSLASLRDASEYPPITVESGTQDYTVSIDSVRKLVDMLHECGLSCDFVERSGGHDWNFWPVCLDKALDKIGQTFKK